MNGCAQAQQRVIRFYTDYCLNYIIQRNSVKFDSFHKGIQIIV
uniref:Uncharacterized protein n=1 Tax=Planktothrix agardhii TaxID=1160 RepID=A0A1J1JB45_PLAAG|nr:protein of unknown function [Planktothrix agardhii]